MRKRTSLVRLPAAPDGERDVAFFLLEVLRSALAIVPEGTVGASILFRDYADRDWFFSALNSWQPIG